VNYLRGLVNLPNETESKVDLQQDGKSTRHKQAAQIRRAVKRHKEMQGKEPRARATTARRKPTSSTRNSGTGSK
jgi:23S rRNA pseudouridine2605 synthase